MTSAIIVAAGKGKRMGSAVNKLFLEVAGRPIIAHTWQAFDLAPQINHVILVTQNSLHEAFEKIRRQFGFKKPYSIVTGGAERQDSVWNGLMATPPKTEIVVIHDGARPCVKAETIQETIRLARKTGAAVSAQRITDTIKRSLDGHTITQNIDRSTLWAVQTPQTFQLETIRRALQEAQRQNLHLTDDTTACELIGQPVSLAPCNTPNPKATSVSDLPYLEMLLTIGLHPDT
jgi:2-C-methyl-D-erythritol 4-phosphate cytidylyltransferase